MHDVVVIGGGVAGLAAAWRLRARGLDVALVEARQRLGGRIHTLRGDGWPAPVEEGAEFVHGRDRALQRLFGHGKLHVDAVPDHHWLRRGDQLVDGDAVWQRALPLMVDGEPPGGEDRSMQARIAAARVDAATRAFARAYVEGFHAAAPARASARAISEQQRAAERVHGEEIRRVREGYDALVAQLTGEIVDDPCELSLGATVERVTWRRGRVTLGLRSSLGRLPALTARRAVVTLPLGVLQARRGAQAVRFSPSLPPAKRRAIAALAMGDVVKIAMRFREPFWQRQERRLGELSFLHAPGAAVPTWWRPLPFTAPMLMGWAGGAAATRLSGRAPDAIARTALDTIAGIVGVAREKLLPLLCAWHVVDWRADRFAAGAYSWVPLGAGDAQAVLAAPVDDTLFFAGEASNTDGASGTVHGAIATGLRAAEEILR